MARQALVCGMHITSMSTPTRRPSGSSTGSDRGCLSSWRWLRTRRTGRAGTTETRQLWRSQVWSRWPAPCGRAVARPRRASGGLVSMAARAGRLDAPSSTTMSGSPSSSRPSRWGRRRVHRPRDTVLVALVDPRLSVATTAIDRSRPSGGVTCSRSRVAGCQGTVSLTTSCTRSRAGWCRPARCSPPRWPTCGLPRGGLGDLQTVTEGFERLVSRGNGADPPAPGARGGR